MYHIGIFDFALEGDLTYPSEFGDRNQEQDEIVGK